MSPTGCRNVLSAFATIVVALALASGAGAQQQTRMPVIGFLGLASAASLATPLEAFHQGLHDRGYVEGKNVAIEYRWASGDPEKLPALAAELVRMRVDVIVTSGGSRTARAAQTATQTIPIVASSAGGEVSSFARPGGNITGSATQTDALTPKRLELLHEAVPAAALVAVLSNASAVTELSRELEKAARSLGVRLYTVEARSEADFDNAFSLMAQAGAGALLVAPDPFFFSNHREIVALAARYKLPARNRR